MKAYVEAYGCTLNYGEAREVEELLADGGWELADSPDGCDLTVIATCVVIDTTERAMLKRIKELSSAPILVITGCMATACREKAELIAPNALFVPPGDLATLRVQLDLAEAPASPGLGPEGRSCSIVPIATGCRGNCAYCITRLARGELRSRPSGRILSAVSRAASRGPREIQLTAQDTAAYGHDLGTDLPTLVGEICALDLDFRLRVGMMNPASALPLKERIAEMYRHRKVFKFLHLPVQSGSDELLDAMDRGYGVEDFKRIVSCVRSAVPGITVSTDLIVGYPGETEEHHKENLDLIASVLPDIVNVTRFSPRPGTKAADSGFAVPGWKAKERSREITSVRFEVSLERNRRWIGRKADALATERGKNDSTILRTDEYKQVVVPGKLSLGSYYEVIIGEALPTYLIGKLA